MKNQTYKMKQEWLEAVMEDRMLSAATKVYGYGIFKAMYGNKTDSFPGAKALAKSTGLADSKFYKYNEALADAGYLEVTPRRGTSNEYKLKVPTPTGKECPLPEGVTPTPEGVTPTPNGGTNTVSKTTTKTTREEANQKKAREEASSISPGTTAVVDGLPSGAIAPVYPISSANSPKDSKDSKDDLSKELQNGLRDHLSTIFLLEKFSEEEKKEALDFYHDPTWEPGARHDGALRADCAYKAVRGMNYKFADDEEW